MPVLLFYLLGESPSTARHIEVEQSAQQDYDGIRHLVASHFAIVEPSGIDFSVDGKTVTEVNDVFSAQGPIAITIDGRQASAVQGPRGMMEVSAVHTKAERR